MSRINYKEAFGILADSAGGWVHQMRYLLTNPDEARELSQDGQLLTPINVLAMAGAILNLTGRRAYVTFRLAKPSYSPARPIRA